MAIYRYVKAPPRSVTVKKPKKFRRRYALIFLLFGLILLGNAVYPIVYYQLFLSPRFQKPMLTPTLILESTLPVPSVLGSEINLVDLTKANVWYPEFNLSSFEEDTPSKNYLLSIPKLAIQDAEVIIGGTDLNTNLIQYPGTGYPGRLGNPVVFGHSVLPQFFNSKNYKTIFSRLPTLKEGDEIIVQYNNVKYRYLIDSMFEAKPTDLSILSQRYDDSYLSLVTCVPPGTYLRRLVVRCRLAPIKS